MKLFNSTYIHGIWGVFSSAAFCVYSWSIVILLWEVPSLLLRYSTGELLGYAAYQFMFAFFESIIVTLSIALLGLILPAKYLRNNFRASGMALVLALAINSIVFKERGNLITWAASTFSIPVFTAAQIILSTWAVSLVVLPIGLAMTTKNEKVKRAVNNFVERLSVLVSLYVILSLLGILLVIARNIN